MEPAIKNLTRRAALALLASSAAVPAWAAGGQAVPAAFPKRPLTLIVPFSAGGPVDVLGRLLAQEYSARSGQTAIVENKTGGAGNIGIEVVRKSAPDGTTLLLIPAGNLTINPTLMPNLSFDVARDFAPVTSLASAPNVIVVSPKLGVTSIKQLIEKAKTTKLSYGSPGVGSQLHLAMELFSEKVGVDILHVPYRGSSQALGDVLGDHIDVLVTNLPAALSAIKGNLVVPLAMTTAQRSPLVPDVPTLEESGVTGIDVTSWYGMLAPKAVLNDVRDAIFTVTKDVLTTPALQEKLLTQGLSVMIEAPDVLAARIKRETALWAGVIQTRHITVK
ncbi:Tripartite-type tricarboxylate transporter, receptor component TctC [Afipia sp. GAS231]|nr:Tripartite-type tricarboxylate transporter, receptor component TctC [Afipia sp. GAS231]